MIENTKALFQNVSVKIRSFAHRVEMDRAVLFALFTKVWGFASAPISAIIIATKFSQPIQGFYYTFGSILALQTFAELGLGVAITQFASHEWANLKIGQNRRIEGHPDSLSRLKSLAKLALKWYSIVAIIVIVGLCIGGYVFFLQSPMKSVSWKLPWIFLCFLTGLNLFLIPLWSLLEGCNQVSNVYFYRLFLGIIGSLTVWSAILLGSNLWTASFVTLVGLIYAVFFLRKNYWEFFKTLLLTKCEGPRVSWQKEILPFQWRIAIGWVSGYFIFSLFTPVLFHYHGAVIAGQMGMTWSLVSLLSATGSAWTSPRVPQFGMLVAQRKYDEMDRLFWRLTIIVTGIGTLGAVAIWLLVFGLNYFEFSLAKRLLPPLPTALFLLATIIYTITGPMAIYMRAHKKEPLLFINILLGILVGLSTWLLGKHYSVLGMAAGYLAIYAMTFPMIVFVWRRYRIKWHDENGTL